MKKLFKRISSIAISLCILATMISTGVVANAYDAKSDVVLSVSADSATVANNGSVDVAVTLDDYADYISGNKVLAAAVVNVSYDAQLVTPDLASLTVADSIADVVEIDDNSGVLTFVLNGDSVKYISAEQLAANDNKLFSVSFNANDNSGKATFAITDGNDTSSTSLAVLDLDVANGADGDLITDAAVSGVGDYTVVSVGDNNFNYESKTITVTMTDANGANGSWYSPSVDGPYYIGDTVRFDTAYQVIYLDGVEHSPWNAYFTVIGGAGSGNSNGHVQLYNGANGATFELDKSGTWELVCYYDNKAYVLMSIDVYPAPTQDDADSAAAFDAIANNLPDAATVTIDDEVTVLAAYEAYEALSPAAQTLVTSYDKYSAVYDAYLVAKYGSVGRAYAYEVISVIAELPEPSEIDLADASDIDYARTKYTMLADEYKQFVDNYKKLVACESALDAIYVSKTITFRPADPTGATNYLSFSETEFYVSDSIKNGAWWQDYTFSYTDAESGITYSGKVYDAYYECASAGISQLGQVGTGNTTGYDSKAYVLTVAGEWVIKAKIEDKANGNYIAEIASFTVLPTPYGNEDNAAVEGIIERINNLPEFITSADVDTVKQLEADYNALVRYDLVPSDAVAKLNEAVIAADRVSSNSPDVSGDGVIDGADLLMIEYMIVGLSDVTEGADIDGNGVVNALDLLKLEQHFLGYSKLF